MVAWGGSGALFLRCFVVVVVVVVVALVVLVVVVVVVVHILFFLQMKRDFYVIFFPLTPILLYFFCYSFQEGVLFPSFL